MTLALVFLARRKPSMDPEEFRRHWRDEHGPLVARHLGDHVLSYRQLHHTGDPGDGYDGAALLEFSSMESFQRFLADPAYAEVVAPDEERFIDRDRSAFVICDEVHQFVGGA